MKNTIKAEELMEKLDEVKTRYSYPSVVDSMLDEVIEIVKKMSKTFSVGDTITIPLQLRELRIKVLHLCLMIV